MRIKIRRKVPSRSGQEVSQKEVCERCFVKLSTCSPSREVYNVEATVRKRAGEWGRMCCGRCVLVRSRRWLSRAKGVLGKSTCDCPRLTRSHSLPFCYHPPSPSLTPSLTFLLSATLCDLCDMNRSGAKVCRLSLIQIWACRDRHPLDSEDVR